MPVAQDYYYKIRTCLARMWAETYIDSASNLQDSKVFCENVIKDLLNDVYDWNLVNGNQETYNVGGFDLKDDSKKILVQVSATTTKEKVNNSIEKSDIDEFLGYRLIMFGIGIGEYPMIYEKTGGYLQPSKITFDKDNDRWTIRTISKEIQNITDIQKLERIANNLQSQYGEVKKWIKPQTPKESNNSISFYDYIESTICTGLTAEEFRMCLNSLFHKLEQLTGTQKRIFYRFFQKGTYDEYGEKYSIACDTVTDILREEFNKSDIPDCIDNFYKKGLLSAYNEYDEDHTFYLNGDDGATLGWIKKYITEKKIDGKKVFIDMDFNIFDEQETQ